MNEPSTALDAQALVLIEEHVRRLLAVMGFEGISVRCHLSAAVLAVSLEAGEDGRVLIGPQGRHIAALQHIVRCLLRSQLPAAIHVTLDVNDYRLRHEESLLHLAQESARKAQRTGRTIVMRPMSASDRRAIHAALSNQKDVRTESLGDEPNRRVLIKPVFL